MDNGRRGTQTADIANCTGRALLWREQFNSEMRWLDVLADNGYTDAARERIALYAKYLRSGYPIPTAQFLRLCDWLDAMAAGTNPAKVLATAKRPGKAPDRATLEKLDGIAEMIWGLNRGLGNSPKYPLNDNAGTEGAFTIAARENHVSEAIARQAWEVFGKSYEQLERTWQQGLPNLAPKKRRAEGKRRNHALKA